MSIPPNLQKLVITGKNTTDAHPGYSTDARTIEQWANIGIVRKLIAGGGITLTPSDGVDVGNGIEIAASGGGGGTSVGTFGIATGPDLLNDGTNANGSIWKGGPANAWPSYDLIQMAAQSGTAFSQEATFGFGWSTVGNGPGNSVCLWPVLQAPLYGGGTMQAFLSLSALSCDGVQQALLNAPAITLTSGQNYQMSATDFLVSYINGGDLSEVAGTGPSGNGLVSASGTPVYMVGVYGSITYPGVTAFT